MQRMPFLSKSLLVFVTQKLSPLSLFNRDIAKVVLQNSFITDFLKGYDSDRDKT